MDELKFNNTSLATYNTFVDLSKTFTKPEKDVELIEIPGRNGSLSFDNKRFRDFNITVPCFIRANFINNFNALIAFLDSTKGFKKFESSKEPDYYRMALFGGYVEPTTAPFLSGASFGLNFTVYPQRFLKSGDTVVNVSSGSTLVNPTSYYAKPIITVTGYGTLNVGSTTITIAETTYSPITIDCEAMNSYSSSTNMSRFITFSSYDYPMLQPGNTSITYTGNITAVSITPRWWTI